MIQFAVQAAVAAVFSADANRNFIDRNGLAPFFERILVAVDTVPLWRAALSEMRQRSA